MILGDYIFLTAYVTIKLR